MFFVRKTHSGELELVRNMLKTACLPDIDLENHIETFMVGELDNDIVSIGGLEIYEDTAVMRSLAVIPDLQGEYLGETTARALINLADKRSVKYIYALIDDEELGYFFAKMRFVPSERSEVLQMCPSSQIPYIQPNAHVWKLDLDKFFSLGCCSVQEE